MKKKEKKVVPKEELLPVWVRLLLILGPLALFVALIAILVAYSTATYRSGVAVGDYLDFTAESVTCGVFAIIFAILIVTIFVMQFVLPKSVFKKRMVKAGIVLNVLALFIGGYMAFGVSNQNFSNSAYRTDDYKMLTEAVECAQKSIGAADEVDRTLTTELMEFLKTNGVKKAVAKGYLGDADTGLRQMNETRNTGYKYKELCEFVSSASAGSSARKITVYDVFVGDKLNEFVNGKKLSETDVALDSEKPNKRNERNCNYGLNTAIRPERVVQLLFGGTVTESGRSRAVELTVMIDVEHGAVRFICDISGTL